LTDGISMQTMRREATEVPTNDRHFEQEGFRALFRDPLRRLRIEAQSQRFQQLIENHRLAHAFTPPRRVLKDAPAAP
jgi:hypothetical protein